MTTLGLVRKEADKHYRERATYRGYPFAMNHNTDPQTPPTSAPAPPRLTICRRWLESEPLVAPIAGLMTGIILDSRWPIPLSVALLVFALSGLLLWQARRRDWLGYAAVFFAAMALGAARHDLGFRRIRADHVVRRCVSPVTPVRMVGTVLSPPRIALIDTGQLQAFTQSPRTRMLVEAEQLAGVKGTISVFGAVAVVVREPVLHVSAGDRVELFGHLYRPGKPENPGEWDWSLVGQRQGVLAGLSCGKAGNVRVLGESSPWARRLAVLRRQARHAMLDNTFRAEQPGAQLLAAMVLGQRSAVSPQLNDQFAAAGTVHYLSVSGAHVGMLASAVWLAGLALGASRRACAAWVLIAITLYAVVTEPRPPILRAVLVGDLLCLAILLRRPVRSLNWLALAAIILLMVQPTQLFEPAFQLSFGTVTALLFLTPRLHETGRGLWHRALGRDDPLLMPEIQRLLNPRSLPRRGLEAATRMVGAALSVTVGASLASLPLAAYHFQRIAPWGWFNNLLILPVVWVVEVLGLVKTAVAFMLPPVAELLGSPLAWATQLLVGLVERLARLPGTGMAVPRWPAWLALAAVGVIALWVIAHTLRIDRRWVATVALAWSMLAAWRLAPPAPTDTCRVDVLAVGAGTACVIQLPDGRAILYDVGSIPPYNLNKWTVSPFLADRRVRRLEAAVISHADLDHCVGLLDVADQYPIRRVLAPPHMTDNAKPYSLAVWVEAGMRARGVPWQSVARGDRLTGTGDVTIEVLWPPPPAQLTIAKANDTAVVLRLSYAGWRVLLCGDIEELAQHHLLASADLKADVLLLPHHGSVEPTTEAFIQAVNPQYCIRSSGQRDAHTHNGLLPLIADRGYFNTADDGAISIHLAPGQLAVSAYRPRPAAK